MPFGGLVVNRAARAPPATASSRRAGRRARRRRSPPASTTAAHELAALAERDAANVEHLRAALGDPPTIVVPELDGDVHDVEGLALVRAHLFGDG